MRSAIRQIGVVTLAIISAATLTSAQTPAQARADNLKLQLEEVKSKQAQMQERLSTLEEQLKPENLDNSLAGVGSTRPEDLREAKRHQLENEKSSVQKQLGLLAETQTRLESAVAQADSDAYHQSARVRAADENSTSPAASKNPTSVSKSATSASSGDSVTPKRQVRPRRVKKTKIRRSQDEM